MYKVFLILVFLNLLNNISYSQPVESYVTSSEFGFSTGINQYFGDLNPQNNINYPQTSFNLFYKLFFVNGKGNHPNLNIPKLSVRFDLDYNRLSYYDAKNSPNLIDYRARNLGFDNTTFGIGAGIEYNFLRFSPAELYTPHDIGEPHLTYKQSRKNKQKQEHFDHVVNGTQHHRSNIFTPYIGIGISFLYTDPYNFDQNRKVYLRPLITERLSLNDDQEKYSQIAINIPMKLGFKFAASASTNIFAEMTYNFVLSDYLDDVSKKYAGIDAFVSNSDAAKFQDTSPNQIYGVKGKDRGIPSTSSINFDSFITFRVGLSFNIIKSCCPYPQYIKYDYTPINR
ncbi:MAG: hypothetical protein QM539_02890 [Alphaproteobacteria bacterium]|nr:hypothetical protein [Alphaproteobacteria bacterium]